MFNYRSRPRQKHIQVKATLKRDLKFEKSFQIETEKGAVHFMPKEQCTYSVDDPETKAITITMPDFMAKQKGMI